MKHILKKEIINISPKGGIKELLIAVSFFSLNCIYAKRFRLPFEHTLHNYA